MAEESDVEFGWRVKVMIVLGLKMDHNELQLSSLHTTEDKEQVDRGKYRQNKNLRYRPIQSFTSHSASAGEEQRK